MAESPHRPEASCRLEPEKRDLPQHARRSPSTARGGMDRGPRHVDPIRSLERDGSGGARSRPDPSPSSPWPSTGSAIATRPLPASPGSPRCDEETSMETGTRSRHLSSARAEALIGFRSGAGGQEGVDREVASPGCGPAASGGPRPPRAAVPQSAAGGGRPAPTRRQTSIRPKRGGEAIVRADDRGEAIQNQLRRDVLLGRRPDDDRVGRAFEGPRRTPAPRSSLTSHIQQIPDSGAERGEGGRPAR